MMQKMLHKLFGTRNERLLKHYKKIVHEINDLEDSIKKLSNEELKAKTLEFKARIKNGESLQSILPEAFAVCREASVRTLNMRHFDVQLIGGIVLNDGKIAEMKTGEGKTLAATLAVYLNALNGNGAHVVTVNDYLAKRDATDMGKLYNFLGLSVGVNLPDMAHEEKKQAYLADITYGTNNEFGFDYLRDNMVYDVAEKVQRGLVFAVVDEVDSILIDEARTPLIISGPAEGSDELYTRLNQLPARLIRQTAEDAIDGDFWVDEKNHNIVLSELGHENVERLLIEFGLLKEGDSLYNAHNILLMHHLLSALKAHYVYIKNQHYVVQNKEVVIVDEFTGRLMSGRRWSDGLHQAVEAKEGVKIQRENQTMASITFQNYFRMFKKLAGMTGTADTEAYEFQQIYGLETVVIPANRKVIRHDYNDKIYMNIEDKYQAVIAAIKECHNNGQPALIGTTSVENSEVLSRLLTQAKLKHEVLNAKQNAREAEIIAQAGSIGAITVATNMAGRGTDIILGGSPKALLQAVDADTKLNEDEKQQKKLDIMKNWDLAHQKVIDCGGLAIIGTERHESRRIDNQLRGRSGRQGDPGSSCFYLSLEDSLLRIFGGERMKAMMQRLGMDKGESIEHRWLSRSIESAQRKVEGHNFDIRKQLLEYDNIANDQRRVIYKQRDEILCDEDLSEISKAMIEGFIGQTFDTYIPPQSVEEMWDVSALQKILINELFLDYDVVAKMQDNPTIEVTTLKNEAIKLAIDAYQNKMQEFIQVVNNDIRQLIESTIEGTTATAWDLSPLNDFLLQNNFKVTVAPEEIIKNNPMITREDFINSILESMHNMGKFQVTKFERGVLLQNIDYYWREHLTQLEYLRQGIHLRGYAQKDPKREYQAESFNLFGMMLDNVKKEAAKMLLTVRIKGMDDIAIQDPLVNNEDENFIHEEISNSIKVNGINGTPKPTRSRNSLCDCGSGKKYKHCCGKLK